MNTNEIKRLIDEGVLMIAPLRARSTADIPYIRAALSRRAA
jgi:hypothetical protein